MMKKIFFSMVYILLVCIRINAQSVIYPDIIKENINSMAFTDQSNGFFVNESGSIYRSTDGGKSWQMNLHIQGCNFKEIHFISKEKGFIYSTTSRNTQSGLLLATTNSGENWKSSFIEMRNAVTFLPLDDATLLKSTTDGEIQLLDNLYGNWKIAFKLKSFDYIIVDIFNRSLNKTNGHTPYGSIKSFQKLSDSLIYAFGTSDKAFGYGMIHDSVNFVLKSLNRGSSWDTLWVGLKIVAKKIVFLNEQSWWLLSQNEILKTSDAGKHWDKIEINPMYIYSYSDIYLLDNMNIYILGDDGKGIYRSSDGGKTWVIVNTELLMQQATKVLFTNKTNGFAFGGDIFKTEDNGNNWQFVSNSIRDNIIDIDFVTLSTGWALGEKGVYKTTSGGKNWTKHDLPINNFQLYNYQSSLKMINERFGWINNSREIYKTTNGGNTWNSVTILPSLTYGRSIWSDSLKGLFYNVRDYNLPWSTKFILATIDGGNTWNKFRDTINLDFDVFKDVAFSDTDNLWGVNNKGVWLSKDFGKSWQKKYSCVANAITFLDWRNGFVAIDYDKKILRTQNGGLSWELCNTYNRNPAEALLAVGPNYLPTGDAIAIYGAGVNGQLLESYFGVNNNYFEQSTPISYTTNTFRSISSIIDNGKEYLWFAGDGFTILHCYHGMKTTDIDEEKEQLPTKFSLSQNYPNPFNPETTIEYSIPVETRHASSLQHVTLKVYDLLGREVATLVNEFKSAGFYNSQFSIRNYQLSSGVYFYRLQAGSYSETKKLILMK